MSSSDEKEPDQPRRACQACKRQRRRCGPWCKFAPYFPPDDDPARYDAVHRIFGRYNVEKLLAQVPPEKWKGAVESIVYEATARARNPRYGCVYDIVVLENLLQRIRDELAATRGAIAVYAGPEVAFLPFEPADATPEVTELSDAMTNATLEELDQQHQEQLMMMLQMARIQQLGAVAERAAEQNMMMQHAAAAVPQYDHDLAQYAAAMGLNVSPGNASQLPLLQTALPMAQAQHLAAGTAPQDILTMPQHPAAAQQQLTATGLDLSLGHGHSTHPHQQTVRMQQAAAVVGAALGSSSGGTVVAFQPLGTADADPFLVQQQPQDDALGLQMDPPLPPLPPALGQQGNDQVPNQQDMDGGDGDLASALRPFFG